MLLATALQLLSNFRLFKHNWLGGQWNNQIVVHKSQSLTIMATLYFPVANNAMLLICKCEKLTCLLFSTQKNPEGERRADGRAGLEPAGVGPRSREGHAQRDEQREAQDEAAGKSIRGSFTG